MADYIVRAEAANGGVRAFAATTRQLVEAGRITHGTTPLCTAALGRLLTAGTMMGWMLKSKDDRLTLQIRGDGPIGGVLVTADCDARVKGYVFNPDVNLPLKANGKLDVGGGLGKGQLTVIRDLGLKEPYVGRVNLVSGEIAEDLTYYFASSEQVPSAVALGVLVDRDRTVKQAGGYIVQLMPDCDPSVIDTIEKKIPEVGSVTNQLEAGKTPEDMLEALLGDFGVEVLERIEPAYYCGCSKKRVEHALLSLGEKDLRELYEAGKPVELGCQFCGRKYVYEHEELGELLKSAK